MFGLKPLEVVERAEEVAQVQQAARLHSAEHAFRHEIPVTT
jgi:hypothetical protein